MLRSRSDRRRHDSEDGPARRKSSLPSFANGNAAQHRRLLGDEATTLTPVAVTIQRSFRAPRLPKPSDLFASFRRNRRPLRSSPAPGDDSDNAHSSTLLSLTQPTPLLNGRQPESLTPNRAVSYSPPPVHTSTPLLPACESSDEEEVIML